MVLHICRLVPEELLDIWIITFSMELILIIERSIVDILSVFSVPSELTSLFCSINICSFISISISSLICLTMEFIIFESTFISHVIGLILAILSICWVLVKLSLVKGTVREDESSSSVGFSVIKPSDIESSVLFVHSSKTVRFKTGLNILNYTSSREPT